MPIKPNENDEQITTNTTQQAQPQQVKPEQTQPQQTQPQQAQDWYQSRAPEHKDVSPQDYLTNYAAFRNYDSIEPALKPYNLNMSDYTWYNDADDDGDFYYAEMKQAAAEGDKEKVEELVESNPVEAANALPDNIPLNTEAEQAIDGGKDTEVDNDAVEDFIKQQEELNPSKSIIEENRKRYEQDMYNDMLNQERSTEVDEEEMNGYGDISVYPEEDKPSMFRFKKGSHNSKKYKELIQSFNSYPTSQRNAALDILGNLNGNIDVDTLRNVNPWMDEGLAMIISQLSEDNPVEKYSKSKLTETNKGILGPKSNSIDWDKVKVYKPGEDPIEWMNKEDYDPRVEENLNYDYEEGVGAPGVLKKKDEDFAGPDELPAQIYDNSDFQPKQLPAVINDGLPAEQYYEPVYDTSDYNFDWYYEDITPEQIDKQVDEDESIPEEEKEEEKEKRKKLLPKLKGRNLTASGSGHGVGSSFKPTYDTVNGSMSFGSGKGIMGSASIGNFMANPKWDKPKQEPVQEVKSEASKAPEPVETVAKSTPIGVKSNPTTSNRTSNGGFNSGGVNKTGNSLIKVNKVSLPSGEANNQPDIVAGGDGISQTNNLRDSRIQQLEARIKELDPELREHFGFSTKYKHVEYNETPIDECSGGQLEEIEEILDACGV